MAGSNAYTTPEPSVGVFLRSTGRHRRLRTSNRIRLDKVSIFDGKLTFLIPHEWVEKQEGDDLYVYCPPDKPGWLRVSLITISGVQSPPDKLASIFEKGEAITDEQTGNLLKFWEEDSEQEGDSIHIFYWQVANAVSPDIVREAVFSYTILAECIRDPDMQKTVGVLDKLIRQTQFA